MWGVGGGAGSLVGQPAICCLRNTLEKQTNRRACWIAAHTALVSARARAFSRWTLRDFGARGSCSVAPLRVEQSAGGLVLLDAHAGGAHAQKRQ